MLNVCEAQKLILGNVKRSRIESKDILDVLGLVLAEDIAADRDYPPFNRATMDGFALKSNDINIKRIKEFKIIGELFAGGIFNDNIPSGTCVKIMTGASLPSDTDCIIQVENSIINGNSVQFTLDEVRIGLNIAKMGEDTKKNQKLLSEGQVCDPAVISLLATLGCPKVRVYSPPSVAIISTGDELVEINQTPLDHQIRDSNSYTLRAFLQMHKVQVGFHILVRDNKDQLTDAVQKGLKEDILILSGGVSMGDADFVPEILNSTGVKKVFHKVKIKPGKPIWFGVKDRSVVFGLPGNPMSCEVGYKMFIEPYIRKFMHLSEIKPIDVPISNERKKNGNREEYFPCKYDNNNKILNAIQFNGSGDISATLNSDGLGVHPADENHLESGKIIKYYPWKLP
ncbi:MAG: molybdopterin molybdotransferase MoeA [Spirochaetota bacterium]|nr:molybdopterin molybdotransferase MoeA [Spirochaetota bacterium]